LQDVTLMFFAGKKKAEPGVTPAPPDRLKRRIP